MADPRRGAPVGLAWLAYWALHGDEDPEFLREFVSDAVNRLAAMPERRTLSRDSESLVADLILVLSEVEAALEPSVGRGFPFHLKLERRKASQKGGRPAGHSYDSRNRRREAAARAFRHCGESANNDEQAIELAIAEMRQLGRAEGLSERVVADALTEHRKQLRRLGVLT